MGLLPIQEKEFVFELTASLQMLENGKAQKVLKCPEELLPILGRGKGYVTSQDGKSLRDWVNGAEVQDPVVMRWRDRLLAVTEKGHVFVSDAWSKVPLAVKNELGSDFKESLFASAKAFDDQNYAPADDELDELNNQIAAE